MTIFELVSSDQITAYWETQAQNRAPYLGEELFPSQQKLGLNIKYIKGSLGLPVVLRPSAYDVAAKKRDRIGFEKLSMDMPFFKEATYIDEELRQELNKVLESGNQAYIDSIVNQVFADQTNLLVGAAAQRERMRMMALTTGAISISANGQAYDYDYGMPENHKVTVKKSWSDPSAPIIDDIRDLQDTIEDETGVRPSRAVISRKTFGYIRKNNEVRQAINGSNATAPVSDTKVTQYLLDELGIDVVVYNKKATDESGKEFKFVPDDTFTMFPNGKLGNGWFGTTPEQSDLMSGSAANVSITDTGVAVTTSKKVDPVNVETKVSMIYLPSFEAANQVGILDVIAE